MIKLVKRGNPVRWFGERDGGRNLSRCWCEAVGAGPPRAAPSFAPNRNAVGPSCAIHSAVGCAEPLEPSGPRCGCWPPSPMSFLRIPVRGRTMELGRSERTIMRPAAPRALASASRENKRARNGTLTRSEGLCSQKVASLFSPCDSLLEKSPKSLIPHSNYPFLRNTLPVFWKMSLFSNLNSENRLFDYRQRKRRGGWRRPPLPIATPSVPSGAAKFSGPC